MNFYPSLDDKINKVVTAIQSVRQLGLQQVSLFTWYKLGLKSGWLRAQTRAPKPYKLQADPFQQDLLAFPTPDLLRQHIMPDSLEKVCEEADEILNGRIRLFGGEAVDLELTPPQPLQHWTVHEGKAVSVHGGDIKYIWEPVRLGWAFILGRAYHISHQEEFSEAFWKYFELFQEHNPPYYGPNWISGQEVSLRILAITFARVVFADSRHSTPQRLNNLSQAIAIHAQRIPPTLGYARAQYNNHLFSEAVGLYTAGTALKGHPQAGQWRKQGWRWLNYAIQTQIEKDGTSSQHSANYHRFILQAVLWAVSLARGEDQDLPVASLERLTATTHWLLNLCVPGTGATPNMGSNDGAYILQLDSCGYADYRPTLQAASQAFLRRPAFEPGPWDEMSLWLGFRNQRYESKDFCQPSSSHTHTPIILRSDDGNSWAYLRAAHFHSRPGHADQLHLDLWWHDLNIAQDAGSFSYNAAPPWDNPLPHTAVHNTLMINEREQMKRAGRFLYLDWANGEILQTEASTSFLQSVTAHHEGYLSAGVYHQRSVQCDNRLWRVVDQVLPVLSKNPGIVQVRLHWLTLDLKWQIQEMLDQGDAVSKIKLQSPYGEISLNIRLKSPARKTGLMIVRGGERLYGTQPCHPTWGWTSPTYGTKIPALSLALSFEGEPPLEVISEWLLPT